MHASLAMNPISLIFPAVLGPAARHLAGAGSARQKLSGRYLRHVGLHGPDSSGTSPPFSTPILPGFPPHGWCFRVLHFEPIGRAAGVIHRVLALRHDAF